MTVDILCKVVDNLGDIGFAYRLARALAELPSPPRLRLIVDDLASFARLLPAVDPGLPLQTVSGILVVRWDSPGDDAVTLFLSERPRLVLECYACGRPSWFESILFDEGDSVPRHVVNLEYLTAEAWACDFHKLPSMTRSPLVRKSVFMPGLVPGTGGLVIDAAYASLLDSCATAQGRLSTRRAVLANLRGEPEATGTITAESCLGSYWVLIFSYEHDFTSIVADLSRLAAEKPVLALVAAGRSANPFREAWESAGRPFPAFFLPLLPQTRWDSLLAAADFSIVRGEESFARACLAGNPFLWQCYPFAETAETAEGGMGASAESGGQLPKVHAFLALLRPYLSEEASADYERLTLAFNAPRGEIAPGDLYSVLRAASIPAEFASFARNVRNIGNLAANLMTYLRDLGYNT